MRLPSVETEVTVGKSLGGSSALYPGRTRAAAL